MRVALFCIIPERTKHIHAQNSSFASQRNDIRRQRNILRDPGSDSGGEGKSKRAGKYGTKKSKKRREEPLGTNRCYLQHLHVFVSVNFEINLKKTRLYNEHYPRILVTFWPFLGETEHFSRKNGALRWSILVGKQKHNVQKPNQFQTVVAVLASDWWQKTCVFLAPVRSQNGGDRLELVW